jgi:hypothetical protein
MKETVSPSPFRPIRAKRQLRIGIICHMNCLFDIAIAVHAATKAFPLFVQYPKGEFQQT